MENIESLKTKKIILSVDPILMEYKEILIKKTEKYFKSVEFILGSEPETDSYYYKKLKKLKTISFAGKIIGKIHNNSIKNYYNRLLKMFINIDYVLVIGEIKYSKTFIELTRKNNKNIKFIKFIWDKMEEREIEEYKTDYDEVYSFEKDDAIAYQIKWRPSFFLEHKICKKEKDFYYLGRERDKERYDYVKKIYEYCIKNKLDYNILLYTQNKKRKEEFLTNKKIKYSQNIENMKKSKVTFEKNIVNQKGLSLRTLECLAYNTKLITTNKDICNYDFYNSNNIIIIENIENIKKIDINFFEKPYIELKKEILNKYSYEGFIEEIFGIKNKEFSK